MNPRLTGDESLAVFRLKLLYLIPLVLMGMPILFVFSGSLACYHSIVGMVADIIDTNRRIKREKPHE